MDFSKEQLDYLFELITDYDSLNDYSYSEEAFEFARDMEEVFDCGFVAGQQDTLGKLHHILTQM